MRKILFLILSMLFISFFSFASEVPLIEPQNASELKFIENRKFWAPYTQPGSLFTDPTQHNPGQYMYIVHVPSQRSFENPDSLSNLLLSASLITQDHNRTFNPKKGVFILKVPKDHQPCRHRFG